MEDLKEHKRRINRKATKRYRASVKGKRVSKNNYYLRNYGITIEQYDAMRHSQKYCCAICLRHESLFKTSLYVDHCHETNKVRELLCIDCNSLLGYCKDNTLTLYSAVYYLLTHNREQQACL